MRPEERELAHVPRWCIVRTIKQQSVAEHAFYVARYAIDISKVMGWPVRTNLIEYCLKHDDAELHSGDIPAPFKQVIKMPHDPFPQRFQLTRDEEVIAKMADILEAILFLIDEQLLGNKGVALVIAELRDELDKWSASYVTDQEGPLGYGLTYWLNLQIDAHSSYRGRIR